MMIHAYSEFYLNDAKQNLADFFDYAINTCHFDANLFSKLFVQSGYADKFERGNPAIVAGMSGIELAKRVIMYAYPNWEFPERIFSEDRSNVYWAGWALAEYQWITCKRFKDIFSRVSLTEIISMYSVYHEMDIEHFVEDMTKKYNAIEQETRLKIIRENRGISQAELAKRVGVSRQTVNMIENGSYNPTVDLCIRICKELKVTLNDLFWR